MLPHTFHERLHRPRFEAGTLRYSALGLAGVILWLLVGELGLAMRDRALVPASLELLRRYAASDHQVSMLLFGVPAALSLLVSPLIGPASDRLRSRWGRRRPFLFVLAPVGALALLGMAGSAYIGGAIASRTGAPLESWALPVFSVAWTLFAAVMLCAQALYSGLLNDVLPPGWLGRFFALYRIVSLCVGIGFYLWVFPLLDRHPHLIVALIAAVFCSMVMLMSVMVREGDYPAPHAPPLPRAPRLARLRADLAGVTALPRIGWIIGALILGGLAFGPFNTFSQYYAESLGVSKSELGKLSSIAYGLSIAVALPVGVLVDRFGAVRMSLLVIGVYGVCIGVGYAMLDDASSFRPVYLLHVVLSGTYFTAAGSLPMALFPRLDFLRYCACKDFLGSCLGIALGLAQGAILDSANHDYRITLLFAACCAALSTLSLARLAWADARPRASTRAMEIASPNRISQLPGEG